MERICPQCETKVGSLATTCWKCNTPLGDSKPDRVCPYCGVKVGPLATVCWKCNLGFSDGQLKMSQRHHEKYISTTTPSISNKKGLVAMAMTILALVMVIIAFMMPWWTLTIKIPAITGTDEIAGTPELVTESLYGLQKVTVKVEAGEFSEEKSFDYDSEEMEGLKETGMVDVFSTVYLLTIITMITIIIALVMVIISILRKISPKIASILVLIALIFSIITPIYFMVTLPTTYNQSDDNSEEASSGSTSVIEGFMGSETFEFFGFKTSINWGPGLGWILMMLAFVFMLLALIFSVLSKP